jgi:hypothetical protein
MTTFRVGNEILHERIEWDGCDGEGMYARFRHPDATGTMYPLRVDVLYVPVEEAMAFTRTICVPGGEVCDVLVTKNDVGDICLWVTDGGNMQYVVESDGTFHAVNR